MTKTSPTLNTAVDDSQSQDALLARADAGVITRHIFPAGTLLFKKGETRHCAFLIEKGNVHIIGNDDGGEDKLLCVIGAGEIFGEMALIDDTPRTASAITTDESEIFVIPRDSLHDRVKGLDPIISLLISLLIERYRMTRIHMPESIKQHNISGFIEKIAGGDAQDAAMPGITNIARQRQDALKEMRMEQELRQALKRKEFVPFLQPILNLPDCRIAGYETLIRWQNPEKGLIFPGDFIPAAERTGVVQALDMLMLEKACAALAEIDRVADGRSAPLFISVNLSGINFGTARLVERIRDIITQSAIDPARLKLEITESALIGDATQAANILTGLKALGVTIALDDFGTGYSSLGYLHKFTIDDIKIDRSFVNQLHDDNRSIDIVRAIVSLARNFDLKIIAEGIEHERDIKTLSDLGCDYAQGYFFARPMSLTDALDYTGRYLSQQS